MMLAIGSATLDISPSRPVPLAGFADRHEKSDTVAHPLKLRALALSDGDENLLLLSADVLWWGADTVAALAQRWTLPSWRPILHATHTHSAPHPSRLFARHLGAVDDDWLDSFLQQSVSAAEAAVVSLRSVGAMSLGKGKCFFPVNRRRRDPEGRVLMAPNFDGPHARELTVLRVDSKADTPDTLLIHLACHPTTKGDAVVSSEFPGVACARVQRQTGAKQVMYLQGFCADQRPALLQGDRFFRGSVADIDYLGEVLAREVGRVLTQPMLPLDHSLLRFWETRTLLPQREELSVEQLTRLRAESSADSIEHHWADCMLRGHNTRAELILQGILLGGELSLLTANAEMSFPYHRLLSAELPVPHMLSLGYTQGMIGYVPTAEQLWEGGYEAVESSKYFLLSAPYRPQAEEVVRKQTASLAEFLFHSGKERSTSLQGAV